MQQLVPLTRTSRRRKKRRTLLTPRCKYNIVPCHLPERVTSIAMVFTSKPDIRLPFLRRNCCIVCRLQHPSGQRETRSEGSPELEEGTGNSFVIKYRELSDDDPKANGGKDAVPSLSDGRESCRAGTSTCCSCYGDVSLYIPLLYACLLLMCELLTTL